MKRIFLMVMSCLFVCAALGTNKTIYKKIQYLNLSSMPWEDEEWPRESFYDYLMRCLDYQINPHEPKKRRIVFKLFDQLSQNMPTPKNVLYDMDTAQDINLLCGKKEGDPYVAQIVDRTTLELGKVFFYALLSSPTDDIGVLTARQNIIRYLISNNELFDELNDAFALFAQSENMMLSLWAQDGFLHLTKKNYYPFSFFSGINDRLNHSASLLEIKSLWDHLAIRTLYVVLGVAAAGVLPLYGISKLIKEHQPGDAPTLLDKVAGPLQGAGGRIFSLLASIQNRWVAGATGIIGGIGCALFIKEDYEWTRDQLVLDCCLQKKMILIANFFKALDNMYVLLENNPRLLDVCPAAAKIITFMDDQKDNPNMQEMRNFCSSSTLQGEPSVFAFQGRVLAAFKLIYDLKESLEPLMLAIGELDAYCAAARLYNEFQDTPVHFCFAEYLKADQPVIQLEEFWNPFINPHKVVANTISLNGPQRRNMIITGPNAGGKSTLIKAVPINLIFAQSMGLVAAKSAKITPFGTIATYLNIVDDIAAGNSLFKAQVLRAQEMVNLVEKLPSTSFSFLALDEMFNGTSAKESTAAAYSVVQYLGRFTNNICIVATHFPLLTQLEKKDTSFENYKVSVEVSEPKGIYYPFKLEKGSSEQHVALDILQQEGYDCTILAQAAEILNML